MLVQAYPSAAEVNAGASATFVVWAWSTLAAAKNVSVQGSVTAESYLGAVTFPICPAASGATCEISSLATGQVYELLASVPVSATATVGDQVSLTAKASASGATSDSSSATEAVIAASVSIPADTATPAPPLLPLPTVPGSGTSAVNPSDLFPIIASSPSTPALSLPAPRSTRSPVHATETASAVPVDARLIGGQLAGLAVLAGAIMIAVARLSLRVPKPVAPPAPAPPPADPGSQS